MDIKDMKVGETYMHANRGPVRITGIGVRRVLGTLSGETNEDFFNPDLIQPLPPPEPPKPKVRLLEIEWNDQGSNAYHSPALGAHTLLWRAIGERGYLGYLMPDGTLYDCPTRTRKLGQPAPSVNCIESGAATIERATHVVCLEVAP